MKRVLVSIIFVMLLLPLSGQMSLCEVDAMMYSSCYELHPDGTFEYTFNHCTGAEVGHGKYTKTRKGILLEFEEYPRPAGPNYEGEGVLGDSVFIQVLDAENQEPLSYVVIRYGKFEGCYTNEEGRASFAYPGESVEVGPYLGSNQQIILHPDSEKHAKYVVYLPGDPLGYTFVKAGKKVHFNKRGGQFYIREQHQRYDEDGEVVGNRWVKVWYEKTRKN